MSNLNLHLATVDQLTDELEKRGYAIKSLWQIKDVKIRLSEKNEEWDTNHKLSDEDALGIMNESLNNDATFNQILECIDYEIDCFIQDTLEEE